MGGAKNPEKYTRTEFSAVPLGEMQGAPCLLVDFVSGKCEGNAPEARSEEISSIVDLIQPGIHKAFVRGPRWGEPCVEVFLCELAETLSSYGVQLVAHRPAMSDIWTQADICWICDTEDVLSVPVEIADLRAKLSKLPYFPYQDEIVVHNCAPENMTRAHLDTLYEEFSIVGSGTIYVPTEYPSTEWEELLSVVSSCHTPWMIRCVR